MRHLMVEPKRFFFAHRCLGISPGRFAQQSAKPRQLPACTSRPMNKSKRKDELVNKLEGRIRGKGGGPMKNE